MANACACMYPGCHWNQFHCQRDRKIESRAAANRCVSTLRHAIPATIWATSVLSERHSMQALKAAGSVFLGIAAFHALVFLFALWVSGILWVSEKIVWYVWTAADIAFWVCLVVLLPLSLFRVTRKASFFGIFGASFFRPVHVDSTISDHV
jgi:hypothetical protein